MRYIYFFASLYFISFLGFGQNVSPTTNSQLKLSPIVLPEQQQSFDDYTRETLKKEEVESGYHVRLIQFDRPPAAQEWTQWQNLGLRKEGYIPYNAWIVSIPSNFRPEFFKEKQSVLQVVKLLPRNKMSRDAATFAYSDQASTVDVLIQPYSFVSANILQKAVARFGKISPFEHQPDVFLLRIPSSQLEKLASLAVVKFIEISPGEPVKDDTPGRSLHRSNAINPDFNGATKYNGKGVSISLADDGAIGPHIDFKGRLNSFISTNSGTHGDMCSGIAVGAGNLDNRYRGMADGATLNLYGINGYPQIVNAVQNFQTLGSVITSTSYSQGCNAYTTATATGDNLIRQNSPLNFVFSAGNNGTANCNYGAGPGWGNITGGYKTGKNVIAVGNVNAFGVIDNTSSRGPAPDGRIKPDICANGLGQMSTDENYTYSEGGGTSAACPGIAGILAQLYQAYRELKNEPNPKNGLMKAILLNTANDLGKPGPDFIFGWGHVNALKALKTIEENRYFTGSITGNGDSAVFNLPIPAGKTYLKAMVYWNDAPGTPSSTINLVNNLDFEIQAPNGAVNLPWKLDARPNATALNAAATTGKDSLNNMEQVFIVSPEEGEFRMVVRGISVPEGPQEFFLVYETGSDEIEVTYPIGGEGFVPGEVETIRWDAFGNDGSFILSYSTNNGQNWININTNVGAAVRHFNWTVPTNITDQALVRVQRGTVSGTSGRNFTISRVPANLRFTKSCIDSITFAWNGVAGATGYEVSRLGPMYMDSIWYTTATSATLAHSFADTAWYSVRALVNDGKGRRAAAVRRFPGLLNCQVAKDIMVKRIVSPQGPTTPPCAGYTAYPIVIEIQNIGTDSIFGATVSYKLGSGNPVSEFINQNFGPGDSLIYAFELLPNLNQNTNYFLTARVAANGDFNYLNDSVRLSFRTAPNAGLFLTQNFQLTTFPPTGWSVQNPDNGRTWARSIAVPAPTGGTTNAALMDNFTYFSANQVDRLTSPQINLIANEVPALTFHRAYAPTTSRTDTLQIMVSTNCGLSFEATGYKKGGAQLQTASPRNSRFTPASSTDWVKDTLILPQLAGQRVQFQFFNKTGGGNSLYIDNVETISLPFTAMNPNVSVALELKVYPNPADQKITILTGSTLKDSNIEIFNAKGQKIRPGSSTRLGENQIELSVADLPNGLYWLKDKSSPNKKPIAFSIAR